LPCTLLLTAVSVYGPTIRCSTSAVGIDASTSTVRLIQYRYVRGPKGDVFWGRRRDSVGDMSRFPYREMFGNASLVIQADIWGWGDFRVHGEDVP